LKNRVKSSKIELRFREVRSEGCTSCTPVLQALIYLALHTWQFCFGRTAFLLPFSLLNWGARLRISGGCPARGEPEALIDPCSSIAWRAAHAQRCTSVLQVQRRRPQPAAETGRSCWGRGQQDTSTAQGAKWMLGAATRRNFSYGSASAGPFFAVCAPQNGAYNKAPPLRFWSGGALLVRFYSRKAVCGIGDWDISARAIRLSLSGGAKQGDTGL